MEKQKKEPKREWSRPGTWFAVPLPKGGYAVGLVTRRSSSNQRHKKILAYVFGRRIETLEKIPQLSIYKARDRVAMAFTDDQGILAGRWPILGRIEPFDLEEWPAPLVKSGLSDRGHNRKQRFEIYQLKDDLTLFGNLGLMTVDDPSAYVQDGGQGYLYFEWFAQEAVEGRLDYHDRDYHDRTPITQL